MLAKKIFGDDHEIMYDSVINHDVYEYLRVSLEVPRGQTTEALILLNNKEIGKVIVEKQGKKTFGYTPFKKSDIGEYIRLSDTKTFRKLGKAVASVVSDYVI